MHRVFEEFGEHMNPPIYAVPHHKGGKNTFKTFEPGIVGVNPARRPWPGLEKSLLGLKASIEKEFPTHNRELVVKTLMSQYYLHDLKFFSRVIFCYRNNFNTWVKSAEAHPTVNHIIRHCDDWLISEKAETFEGRARQYWELGRYKIFEAADDLVDMGVRFHMVPFESDWARRNLFKELGLEDDNLENALGMWRGSAHEKK
jgi:hypothetical protein